ncbi:RecX family transcriptional regulator [Yinghuangia sp. ASG 101]|uniref:regulatory protein RecX n=1 Tax=Yinghuangia sp. ASG 101 TaxID=2896848 RepID=UPI003FCD40CD
MRGRGGEHGEAADADGAAPPGDTVEWNDTWAGEVSPEEQARARALLGRALAGGQGASAAVEEWTRARARPTRAGRGAGSRTDRLDATATAPDREPRADDATGGTARGRRRASVRRGPTDGYDGDGGAASRAGGPGHADDSLAAWAGGDGSDDDPAYDPGGHDEAEGFPGRRRRGRRSVGGGRRGEGTRAGFAEASGFDAPDADDEDGHGEPGRPRGGRRDGGGQAAEPGSAGRRRAQRTGPAQIDPDADPEAAARAICLRQLTGQPRTRAQLADALRRRGVPDDVAEHVLGRFTEVKLIDDAAFAAAWVDTRHAGRGLARRALARELRQRGVDPDLVDEAVERLDPEQEWETARALVARKLPGMRRLDRHVRMRRLAGMLARKGYGEGLALRVVREALDADDADSAWDDDEPPPEPEF